MSQGSMIDRIYRSLLLSKYFTKGWGSPKDIKRLLAFRKIVSERHKCLDLIPEHYPVEIVKDQVSRGVRLIEGKFHSPFDLYLPELLPKEVKMCHFQMLLPVKWAIDDYNPVCIHMAGTGDHFYWRRRNLMAKPLLTESCIGSIIVENPFYGVRKPPQQTRSILNNVLDIFTMGGCLIMEGMILHSWCKKNGLGPIGFTGYSMGGHMATLAATSIPEPVVLVPCLSWSTASGVFTEGVMSHAIDWDLLLAQYNEDESFKNEIKNTVKSLSEDAFKAGKKWIQTLADSKMLVNGFSLKSDNVLQMATKGNEVEKSDKDAVVSSQKFFKKWKMDFKENVPISSNYEKRFEMLSKLNRVIFSSSDDSGFDLEQHEAYHFMKGIMDECTHIANFSTPVDTSLVIAVCAKDDAYVPRGGVSDIRDIWPAAEVRYVDGGHVLAFVLQQKMFRKAVVDAFERYRTKYLLEPSKSMALDY